MNKPFICGTGPSKSLRVVSNNPEKLRTMTPANPDCAITKVPPTHTATTQSPNRNGLMELIG